MLYDAFRTTYILTTKIQERVFSCSFQYQRHNLNKLLAGPALDSVTVLLHFMAISFSNDIQVKFIKSTLRRRTNPCSHVGGKGNPTIFEWKAFPLETICSLCNINPAETHFSPQTASGICYNLSWDISLCTQLSTQFTLRGSCQRTSCTVSLT